jgi:hypothetical protein
MRGYQATYIVHVFLSFLIHVCSSPAVLFVHASCANMKFGDTDLGISTENCELRVFSVRFGFFGPSRLTERLSLGTVDRTKRSSHEPKTESRKNIIFSRYFYVHVLLVVQHIDYTAGFTPELIFVELRKSKFSIRCGRTPLSTIRERQDFCMAVPILRFTAAAKVRSKESSLFLLRATKRCNDVNN